MVLTNDVQEFRHVFGRIRVITIDHDVVLSVDHSKHRLYYVAFPLSLFAENDGTSILGYFGRAILTVVVEYTDIGVGKDMAEIADYLRHGEFFVVAGNQNGHAAIVPSL